MNLLCLKEGGLPGILFDSVLYQYINILSLISSAQRWHTLLLFFNRIAAVSLSAPKGQVVRYVAFKYIGSCNVLIHTIFAGLQNFQISLDALLIYFLSIGALM
jgi:hypothetical protein